MTSSPSDTSSLQGLRVLVVEDEMTIAMLIEDMLMDVGCEVVGPIARLPAALESARSERLDAAIVDVNVAGEEIYPVVDVLAARGIPAVFSTGYGAEGLRPDYRDRPVLQKPFTQADLERRLRTATGR